MLAPAGREWVGEQIAIYFGGLYKEKEISFLLKACIEIRTRIHDFNIILIGDGPQATEVKEFAQQHDWAHYLGEITGVDRVPYFRLARICLMPGLVGLVVLDSFTLECPLITTDISFHSPEIDYLSNGQNGMITPFNVSSYASVVVKVLETESLHETLVAGCKRAKNQFTIEKMAQNFCGGILEALAS